MSNRLATEKSPYLRQHAENPVDWHPWGEEALAKARAEQKPIFLSIGYSTCHWCHVMAHESFEDAGIAAALNAGFVPVKVDREERPDLDRVYMTYVQQTTGHGGWPMSVWLTPDGKPFYGGTYFPPDDRHGRPGFLAVLKAITRHWQDQREKILTGADEVVKTLQRYAAGGADPVGLPLVGTPSGASASDGPTHTPLHEAAGEAFEQGYQYFHDAFDAQWGGFGGAPKFPRASVVNFLFRIAALQGPQSELGADVVGMTTYTLQRMAEGGLHDHVGGGFHRYSVDNEWFVPHFEKMLYDQAQIALNYLEARQATGREVYAWIARGIFSYVQRELTGPHGGFYSAEDADSLLPAAAGESESESGKHGKHAEGAFYVWTKAEIDRVLGGGVPSPREASFPRGEGTPPPIGTEHDAAFFCAHYGVKTDGNVAHDPQGEFTGKNILMQRRSLVVTAREFNLDVEAASVKLLTCLEKLQVVRAQRPRPHLDDKVITAWNGLMISAFAKGHQLLGGAPTPVHGFHDEVVRLRPSATARQVAAPYLAAATRAAEFIECELYEAATGVLYRSWCDGRSNIAGFAEDYAYLIQGLLDLYEAGFAIHWLQWAVGLQVKMDALFWDPERGGYFNSRADDPTVIVRLKEDYDGAEPAANSVAALNLVRLDWMLGGGARPTPAAIKRGEVAAPPESSYREKALRTIAALRAQWSRVPHGLPQMLCAVELALTEPRTVVLAGDPRSADFQALAAVLHEKLGPRRALLAADGGAGQQWLAERRPYLAEMKPLNGRATAYVCENFTCQQPVNEVAELRGLLG